MATDNKLKLFLDFHEPNLKQSIIDGLNKNLISIVTNAIESDVMIKISPSDDLCGCVLPTFESIERFGAETHFVPIYTKTRKLALRIIFDQNYQKLSYNLNILAYHWLLKQSIESLPSLTETKCDLLVNDESASINQSIKINLIKKVRLNVESTGNQDRYYHLLYLSESGMIHVLNENQSSGFESKSYNMNTDPQSPFNLTHQNDEFVLLSSSKPLDLSEIILANSEGYATNFSRGIICLQKLMKMAAPNFNDCFTGAQIIEFEVQRCVECSDSVTIFTQSQTSAPPLLMLTCPFTIPVFEKVMKDPSFQKDDEDELSPEDVNDFQEFFKLYSFQQKYQPDVDSNQYYLIFEKKSFN